MDGVRLLGFSRWQLFKGLVLALGGFGVVSLALTYFIPARHRRWEWPSLSEAVLWNITAGAQFVGTTYHMLHPA
jgi:hypothetical protein